MNFEVGSLVLVVEVSCYSELHDGRLVYDTFEFVAGKLGSIWDEIQAACDAPFKVSSYAWCVAQDLGDEEF